MTPPRPPGKYWNLDPRSASLLVASLGLGVLRATDQGFAVFMLYLMAALFVVWRVTPKEPPTTSRREPDVFVLKPRELADGTLCNHEGETSNYCTRCWAPLKPGVGGGPTR